MEMPPMVTALRRPTDETWLCWLLVPREEVAPRFVRVSVVVFVRWESLVALASHALLLTVVLSSDDKPRMPSTSSSSSSSSSEGKSGW